MDSKSKILVRFYDEDDGSGKLWVRATSGGFSGEGSAWFGVDQIQDFAEAIAAYPLSELEPVSIRGGFYARDMSGKLDQEHLVFRVYPIDSTGHLGFQVIIATEVWPQTRPDSQHCVKLEILTTHQPVIDFGNALKALVAGEIKEAIIEGELGIAAG